MEPWNLSFRIPRGRNIRLVRKNININVSKNGNELQNSVFYDRFYTALINI